MVYALWGTHGGPLGVSEPASRCSPGRQSARSDRPTSFCPPFDAANICSRADGVITRGKGGGVAEARRRTMAITTHTTVFIAKTLIWSHIRTARRPRRRVFLVRHVTTRARDRVHGYQLLFARIRSCSAAARRDENSASSSSSRPTAGHLKPQVETALPRVATFWRPSSRTGALCNPTASAAASRSALMRGGGQSAQRHSSRSSRPTVSESEACAARRPLAIWRGVNAGGVLQRRRVARGVSTLCAHQGQPLPDVETPRPIDEAEQEPKRLDRERLQEEARRKAEQLKAQSTQAERGRRTRRKTRPMRSKGEPEP